MNQPQFGVWGAIPADFYHTTINPNVIRAPNDPPQQTILSTLRWRQRPNGTEEPWEEEHWEIPDLRLSRHPSDRDDSPPPGASGAGFTSQS